MTQTKTNGRRPKRKRHPRPNTQRQGSKRSSRPAHDDYDLTKARGMERPIQRVLKKLDNVQLSGDQYSARCPAHPDSTNSLSVGEDADGKVLLCCQAGCEFKDIVEEMGLEQKDLFPNGRVSSNRKPKRVSKTPEKQRRPQTTATDKPRRNWPELAKRLAANCSQKDKERLANKLGVSVFALTALQVGHSRKGKFYSFPEHNSKGQVTGILRRMDNGAKKRTIEGSKRGLTLPTNWEDNEGPLLIVEGPSDTAAACDMGLAAIGRPSALVGVDLLVKLLADMPSSREIIVLGENDTKPDGKWPGLEGAKKVASQLAERLQRPIKWALPPKRAKDLRSWFVRERKRSDGKDELGSAFLSAIRPNEVNPEDTGPRIEFMNTAKFSKAEFQQQWLVNGMLVAGQPAVLGGPKKSLKTSLLVDLTVALGGGRKFLGHFKVDNAVRVGFISGESGGSTLQDTFRRIRESHHDVPQPRDIKAHWCFNLPQLTDRNDLDALEQAIKQHQLEVVILDPLYLCLLAGNTTLDARNLYHIGPLLAGVTQLCLEAGATPILAHHTSKGSNYASKGRRHRYEVPELEDLAYAGVQEFARQWMLVGRREKYELGTGSHRLWLNVGGSAGFSGLWSVDIDEGVIGADFGGRRWNVTVKTAAEERRERAEERAEAKATKAMNDQFKVLEVLEQHPEGETKSGIAKRAGLNVKKVGPILDELLDNGQVQKTKVTKRGGKAKNRAYDGYKSVAAKNDDK